MAIDFNCLLIFFNIIYIIEGVEHCSNYEADSDINCSKINNLTLQIPDSLTKHWSLNIVLNESQVINLSLKRTEVYNTTVYYFNNLNNISKDLNIDEILKDVHFYQDPIKRAALMTYENDNGIKIAEGFVGEKMIRFSPETYYILWDKSKVKSLDLNVKYGQSYTLKTDLKSLHLKLLINTNWNDIKNKSNSNVIKDVLMYYNAVDMMFSNFTSPEIKITLAGIVLPECEMCSLSNPNYFELFSEETVENLYEICYDLAINMTSDPNFMANETGSFLFKRLLITKFQANHKIHDFLDVFYKKSHQNYTETAQLLGFFLGAKYINDNETCQRIIDDNVMDDEWINCNIQSISKKISHSIFCDAQSVEKKNNTNSNDNDDNENDNDNDSDSDSDNSTNILALSIGIPILIIILIVSMIFTFFMLRYIPLNRRPIWLENIQEKLNCYIPTTDICMEDHIYESIYNVNYINSLYNSKDNILTDKLSNLN